MKDLTFIIPLHEYKKDYFENAIKSVSDFKDCKIMIVGPSLVLDEVKNGSKELIGSVSNIVYTENNSGKNGFCDNVNFGVFACTTKFFCILEYDDTITPTWVKNVSEHANSYKDVSVFLPLIEMVSDDTKYLVSLNNELAWSSSFAEELGYLDIESLKSYYDFSICGGVFKTEDFISLGGLKESMMIAAPYEFLLRCLYNSKKIYVIPKIGCIHTYGREGSYMVLSKDRITQEHGEWLIKTAQQEMFFKEDRNKAFNE